MVIGRLVLVPWADRQRIRRFIEQSGGNVLRIDRNTLRRASGRCPGRPAFLNVALNGRLGGRYVFSVYAGWHVPERVYIGKAFF
jgi:hypothetical protein